MGKPTRRAQTSLTTTNTLRASLWLFPVSLLPLEAQADMTVMHKLWQDCQQLLYNDLLVG